jgi:hypothetical protein
VAIAQEPDLGRERGQIHVGEIAVRHAARHDRVHAVLLVDGGAIEDAPDSVAPFDPVEKLEPGLEIEFITVELDPGEQIDVAPSEGAIAVDQDIRPTDLMLGVGAGLLVGRHPFRAGEKIHRRTRHPRQVDRGVVVEARGQRFPFVAVARVAPTNQELGDLETVAGGVGHAQFLVDFHYDNRGRASRA